MMFIPGYREEQEVHASALSRVFRARRESDGLRVVVKALRGASPAPAALAQLRREYAILSTLNIPEVVHAVALEPVGSSLALVVEDSGGEPLDAVVRQGGLETGAFLRLAIAISRAVQAIHSRRVIHKDLKPQHLLRDPSGAVRIIDFGFSTTDLARETCAPAQPDALQGTLPYLAPEQTGRVNRPVDRRSDLYSLGVSLFELATGRLPFSTTDPLELVHCHVARSPPRADAVRPDLPSAIASILEKLMAKAAEDRYQSATGLLTDLERCLTKLETSGGIAPFDLGSQDLCEDLQIPDKLYGRATALAVLEATFEQARAGIPQVLLLRGPSGIGKSALVLELSRKLVLHGHLVSGKFDPLTRGEPYSALISACRALVRAILQGRAATLDARRGALLEALGPNARLILDLVPELELVIGPCPLPSQLGPSEARARFEQTFESFLGALAPGDDPLAIFLDDLQWADAASLRLLRRIATGPHRPILLVGAYRDDEVTGVDPLLLEVDEMERAGAVVTQLRLDALGIDEITELLGDALSCPAPEVRPLAAVVFEKTRGNPFHLRQFVEALCRDGLLRVDAARHRWVFDLVAVRERRIAANVVDLVVERLRLLSPVAQRVLGLGACVGHEFDWRIMRVISELDCTVLAAALEISLREGLLVPLDENHRYLAQGDGAGELNARFRFAHDRVQQAAYSLIEASQLAAVHLRIGRLLRDHLGEDLDDDGLFAVARQMNRGWDQLSDAAERDWLAQVNLRCARKAHATGASSLAQEHAERALALVGTGAWAREYSFTLAVRMLQAECEYVQGGHERALAILDEVSAHARGVLDLVAAKNLRTAVLTGLGKLRDACACGAAALRALGCDIPELDDAAGLDRAIEAEETAVQALLAAREVGSLVHLPELEDPIALANLRTLAGLIPAAYQVSPKLVVLLEMMGMRIAIVHGASDLTSFFVGQYAIARLSLRGDHVTAHHLGKLAIEIGQSRTNLAAVGPALFLFAAFTSHWIDPVAESVHHFAEALKRCLEAGDVLHAGYCLGFSALHRLHAGVPLADVRAALPADLEAIDRLGDVINRNLLSVCQRTIASMTGACEPFGPSTGDGVEVEDPTMPAFALGWLHAAQAMARFHAGQYARALEATAQPEPPTSLVAIVDVRFYAALSHAGLARVVRGAERARHLSRLGELIAVFDGWAELSPANQAHRRALLAAEKADLEGDAALALDLYEEAIERASRHGFVHHHALACELSGEFHLRHHRLRLGRTCLEEAIRAYERWGATGKVQQLKGKHRDLDLGSADDTADTAVGRPQRRSSTSGVHGSADLDLDSAMRASQAIAGELGTEALLERLVSILVESAGAQRGVLLAPGRDGLGLEAERVVEPDAVRLLRGMALTGAEVPEQLIRYVERTRQTVVLPDAAANPESFGEDPYLQSRRPRSVLCIAMLHRGELGAVLYLEHQTAGHVFGPARIERIQFLAGLAAAALANSRLYEQVQGARRDLEERVRARTAELIQRNGELRGVLDAVSQGLLTLDREGRVVGEVSAKAESWFGPLPEGSAWTDVLARIDETYAHLFADAYAKVVAADWPAPAVLARVPRRLALGGRVLDVAVGPVGGPGSCSRMLLVITDATDEESRKALELELHEAQKLEAVGQIAAGIAHEINTPIQFIGDGTRFVSDAFTSVAEVLRLHREAAASAALADGVKEDLRRAEDAADLAYAMEEVPKALAQMLDGVQRVTVIVRAMKEFAHPDQKEMVPTDLNRALAVTLAISRNEYKYVADVETDFGQLPPVSCHAGDMNQVFLNIIVNAAHAIGDVVKGSSTKGRIAVQTRVQGDRVVVRISDTGPGIPCEIRDKVFEPFFTTKPVGKGTGQGLAIARSVVKNHGGQLTFESDVGKGTTFVVRLPIDCRPRDGRDTGSESCEQPS